MNRKQAEHILDAYVQTIKFVDDEEPSVSLREVILDAMTEYKIHPSGITYPYITLASDNTPKITYTGIDPAFNNKTVVGV